MSAKRRGKRPIYPAFGAYLRGLRFRYAAVLGRDTERDVTLTFVRRELALRGIRVPKSTLSEYERGIVEKPDAAVVAALADLYNEPILSIVRVLIADRYLTADHPPVVRMRLLDSDAELGSPPAVPPAPKAPLAVVAAEQAAARLLLVSEELQALAESFILKAARRQNTNAGPDPTSSDEGSGTPGGSTSGAA